MVLNRIKKSLEGAKGFWTEDLSAVLWSVKTTVNEATGHSPFSLANGSKAIMPVEVGIPFPGITFYEYEHNGEDKRINLDLLPNAEVIHY